VLSLEPDVLVVGLGANDMLDAAMPDGEQPVYHPLTFALRNWLLRRNLTGLLPGGPRRRREGRNTRLGCRNWKTTDNLRAIAAQAKATVRRLFFFLPVFAGSADMLLHGVLPPEARRRSSRRVFAVARARGAELFLGGRSPSSQSGRFRLLAQTVADT
jgi:hypothetical protein